MIYNAVAIVFMLIGCSTTPTGPGTGNIMEIKELRAENVSREIPDIQESHVKTLVKNNSAFAFDLYKQLTLMPEISGKNIFFSPFSISTALTMTFAGAEGQTESEMYAALRFTLVESEVHKVFNYLDNDLNNAGSGNQQTSLSIINQLWGQFDWPFQKPFLEKLAKNYGAGINLLNFSGEPDSSRIIINQWVEEKTQDKIKNLLPEGSIDHATALVLTNVIYFLADWKMKFDPNLTKNSDFTMEDGKKITIPLMNLSEIDKKVKIRSVITDKSIAVELPYAGNRFAMIAMLPKAGNLSVFEQSFDTTEFANICSGLDTTELRVVLPRFSFGTPSMKLKEPLQQMGMKVPFTDNADFSEMDGTRTLFIDNVYHKAFITVNESGTEAAAATAVVMNWESSRKTYDFIGNRPFLYVIRDQKTGTILFMGRVMDPSDNGE
ncbi:MAG: serpin family protein [Fibrobacter sp.]|nr:serpin family protein [Fibrobacter sp.]